MTKKEAYAYIAGIIDGEAYVGIKKSTYAMRKRKDTYCPTYSGRIQIRMNNRKILEFIQSYFGGYVGTEKRIYNSVSGFRGTKIMSIYRADHKKAATIIEKVRPYLIEKAIQANCIMALRQNKQSISKKGLPKATRMSSSVIAFRENLYQKCKNLHK